MKLGNKFYKFRKLPVISDDLQKLHSKLLDTTRAMNAKKRMEEGYDCSEELHEIDVLRCKIEQLRDLYTYVKNQSEYGYNVDYTYIERKYNPNI